MKSGDWDTEYGIFMGLLASGVDCASGDDALQCKEFFDTVKEISGKGQTGKEKLAQAVKMTRLFLSDGGKSYHARWLMHDAIEVLQGNLEGEGIPLSVFGLERYDPERVVMLANGFNGA